MARKANASQGVAFKVTLAEQSIQMLERLAKLGSYGRNSAEVGGRLLEQVLTQRFTERPRYKLDRLKRR